MLYANQTAQKHLKKWTLSADDQFDLNQINLSKVTLEKINLSDVFLETHSSQTFDVISIAKIVKELSSSKGPGREKRQTMIYKTPGID